MSSVHPAERLALRHLHHAVSSWHRATLAILAGDTALHVGLLRSAAHSLDQAADALREAADAQRPAFLASLGLVRGDS